MIISKYVSWLCERLLLLCIVSINTGHLGPTYTGCIITRAAKFYINIFRYLYFTVETAAK